MLKIKFEYCDEMSRGEWREQECIVRSVEECKRIRKCERICIEN